MHTVGFYTCTPGNTSPEKGKLWPPLPPDLVLLLLLPAVAVITLGVGFHGHGGEEVLHGVVAQIITDTSKLQQKPERQTAVTHHSNAFGLQPFTCSGFHWWYASIWRLTWGHFAPGYLQPRPSLLVSWQRTHLLVLGSFHQCLPPPPTEERTSRGDEPFCWGNNTVAVVTQNISGVKDIQRNMLSLQEWWAECVLTRRSHWPRTPSISDPARYRPNKNNKMMTTRNTCPHTQSVLHLLY